MSIEDMIPDCMMKRLFEAVRQYRNEVGRNGFGTLVNEVQKINGISRTNAQKADEEFVMLQPKMARYASLHSVLREYSELGTDHAVPSFLEDWRQVQQLMYAQFGSAHG